MGIVDCIKQQYKDTLINKYNGFKACLEEECFVPDIEEVWKMYSRAFNENNGIYFFAAKLLELEQYDEDGKLNELSIFLDETNRKMSDYCSAYALGIEKSQNKNSFKEY